MLWLQVHDAAQTAAQIPATTTATGNGDLIRGLAAGALGLIGTVVTIAVGWLRDRDTTATRMRQLEEESKRIALWQSWHESITPLDSGTDSEYWKERARTQMWLASCKVKDLFESVPTKHATANAEDTFELRRQRMSWWRRWFLFYMPPRAQAWIPRVLFYMYFFVAPPVSVLQQHHLAEGRARRQAYYAQKIQEISAKSQPTDTEIRERVYLQEMLASTHDKRWRDTDEPLASSFGLGSALIISLLFRWWSYRLERPKENSSP